MARRSSSRRWICGATTRRCTCVKRFNVAEPQAIASLLLEAQYDDGINVWINGTLVVSANVAGSELPYGGTAASAIENVEYVPFSLPDPSTYLVAGTNEIAVQLLNASLNGSSDAFFDARLTAAGFPGPAATTPGARNSVYQDNAPPQMRQVAHTPRQPTSHEPVTITIKATDPDGVASVTLAYQSVDPGDYISLSDPRYLTQWTTLPMFDDGTHGDGVSGDAVYTAVLPGELQTHRQLVRYRISATDTLGASVTGPYDDDPQPNFAYFVYDGVPAWTGSVQPGVTAPVTYDSELLSSVPTYHLITSRIDHLTSQSVPYRYGQADEQLPDPAGDYYWGSDYAWEGTLVYDGQVYDHIGYRARGGVWRYSMGKNQWKFDFTRGHGFQARDDFGEKYDVAWDKLNLSALIQQGNFLQRGEQGLFESAGFQLHNLAGNPAPQTNYVQLRIIAGADELGTDQYSGDFQGLYLAIEEPDGRFLDEHGLPDGNLYKMEGGTGTLSNQGSTQPTDKSDLNALLATYQSGDPTPPDTQWWRDNVDLEDYYSFRAIMVAIHDYDKAFGKNYYFYHNPETNKWSIYTWDLDLTWTTTYGGGGGAGPLQNDANAFPPLNDPVLRLEYNNRVRELVDLLFNTEQTGKLLDQIASFVYQPGQPSLVDADRAMWDYNPILASDYVNGNKAGQGKFYEHAPTRDFAGMLQIMKDYVQNKTAAYLAGDAYAFDPIVASDEGQATGDAPRPLHRPGRFSDRRPAVPDGHVDWRQRHLCRNGVADRPRHRHDRAGLRSIRRDTGALLRNPTGLGERHVVRIPKHGRHPRLRGRGGGDVPGTSADAGRRRALEPLVRAGRIRGRRSDQRIDRQPADHRGHVQPDRSDTERTGREPGVCGGRFRIPRIAEHGQHGRRSDRRAIHEGGHVRFHRVRGHVPSAGRVCADRQERRGVRGPVRHGVAGCGDLHRQFEQRRRNHRTARSLQSSRPAFHLRRHRRVAGTAGRARAVPSSGSIRLLIPTTGTTGGPVRNTAARLGMRASAPLSTWW